MKCFYLIFSIFSLLALCVIPAAASQEIFDSEYQIEPWSYGFIWHIPSTECSSVGQDGIKQFKYPVDIGSKELHVRVSWDLPSKNSLSLKIIAPTGLLTGTYTDTYESSDKNGMIPVRITSSLLSGDWWFEVIGCHVSDKQSFTISIEAK